MSQCLRVIDNKNRNSLTDKYLVPLIFHLLENIRLKKSLIMNNEMKASFAKLIDIDRTKPVQSYFI